MVLPAEGEEGTAGDISVQPRGSAAAGVWDSLTAPGSARPLRRGRCFPPTGSSFSPRARRAPVPTPDLLRSQEAPSHLVLLGTLPLVLRQEMDGPPLEQRSPCASDRRSKAAGGRS